MHLGGLYFVRRLCVEVHLPNWAVMSCQERRLGDWPSAGRPTPVGRMGQPCPCWRFCQLCGPAGPSGRGVANEGVEAKRYWLLRRPAAQTHLWDLFRLFKIILSPDLISPSLWVKWKIPRWTLCLTSKPIVTSVPTRRVNVINDSTANVLSSFPTSCLFGFFLFIFLFLFHHADSIHFLFVCLEPCVEMLKSWQGLWLFYLWETLFPAS